MRLASLNREATRLNHRLLFLDRKPGKTPYEKNQKVMEKLKLIHTVTIVSGKSHIVYGEVSAHETFLPCLAEPLLDKHVSGRGYACGD